VATQPKTYPLDPSDQFEAVLIEMAELHKRKGADYAEDTDVHSNFRRAGDQLGVSAWHQCESLIATKMARLRELYPWRSGKKPKNEALRDTVVDRAVYSTIAVCLFDDDAEGGK